VVELRAEVEQLRALVKQQQAIISELLKRLYGSKSEQIDPGQLLLLLQEEDGAKKADAAEPGGPEPEAKPAIRKSRAKRTNKLSDSLQGLPSIERVIVAPEVLANPAGYRLIGEEVSERLHVNAQSFTREIIRRQTHVKRGDLDGAPITPALEPCLLPGSVLTPSLGAMLLTEKFCLLFDWHNSRGADCLKDVLLGDSNNAAFAGHLQSDGYSAYRAFLTRHPDLKIKPVSCLAHIRRKFIEACEDQPRLSAWVLIQIAKIYELEARLRERGASPELRRRARRRWSQRRYQHLIRLTKHLVLRRRITPRSPLGKALHYAHDQWPQLQACFQHGHIDFDNNSVENAIRPTKLGAKNWMFVGGKDTGWRSAVIYTFVEQVRAQHADPFRYLEWLFTELMHHPHPTGAQLDALMPAAWLQLHSSSCKLA
jgi:hypothetical protein